MPLPVVARADRALLGIFRYLQRLRNGARLRYVTTDDGREWPVYHSRPEQTNMGEGVPIVFLHGFGNDGATWLPYFPLLGVRRELASPDLPGFGRHILADNEQLSPRWYSAVVSELLRELTVRWGQPPIVVGKSMGGLVGGLVAGEVPALVRALVLISPAGLEAPVVSDFWKEWSEGKNRLLPENHGEWDEMTRLMYHRPPRIPSFMARVALQSIASNRRRYERIFDGLMSEGYNPLGDALHRVTCPVTVIWGEEDRVMDPSGATIISERIPSADIHFIPECGHSPTRETPGEVNRILLRVLSRWG